MIRRISIQNYAIIDKLEFTPTSGLNVISGETGAGKSIILGALQLILGQRADLDILYDKSTKCVVEGEFNITGYNLEAFFMEAELEYFEDGLIIRREILPAGRSRAFVNDSPVKLEILQNLQASLIDLHQQFSTLDLHNLSFQEKMLDVFCENMTILHDYKNGYRSWKEKKEKLQILRHQEKEARKEEDYLRFQLNEIEELSPIAGEEEELDWELKQLEHAEEIKQKVSLAVDSLTENELSLSELTRKSARELASLSDFSKELENLGSRLEGVSIELDDISSELQNYAEKVHYDPTRIEELRQRLDQLQSLLFKHQLQSATELVKLSEHIQSQLESTESLQQEIADLEIQLEAEGIKLEKTALALRDRRIEQAPNFSYRVEQMLSSLSMDGSVVKIEIHPLETFGPNGMDKVEFLFSANTGTEPGKIKNMASGGELSRLALCIKSLVAGKVELPTMIFDEIDSGVSGDVASRMGMIMLDLAKSHQLIVITHIPQVAAVGEKHFFVYKEKTTGRTVTRIKALEGEERITSIASMLGTSPPSKAAISNAKDLLNKNI